MAERKQKVQECLEAFYEDNDDQEFRQKLEESCAASELWESKAPQEEFQTQLDELIIKNVSRKQSRMRRLQLAVRLEPLFRGEDVTEEERTNALVDACKEWHFSGATNTRGLKKITADYFLKGETICMEGTVEEWAEKMITQTETKPPTYFGVLGASGSGKTVFMLYHAFMEVPLMFQMANRHFFRLYFSWDNTANGEFADLIAKAIRKKVAGFWSGGKWESPKNTGVDTFVLSLVLDEVDFSLKHADYKLLGENIKRMLPCFSAVVFFVGSTGLDASVKSQPTIPFEMVKIRMLAVSDDAAKQLFEHRLSRSNKFPKNPSLTFNLFKKAIPIIQSMLSNHRCAKLTFEALEEVWQLAPFTRKNTVSNEVAVKFPEHVSDLYANMIVHIILTVCKEYCAMNGLANASIADRLCWMRTALALVTVQKYVSAINQSNAAQDDIFSVLIVKGLVERLGEDESPTPAKLEWVMSPALVLLCVVSIAPWYLGVKGAPQQLEALTAIQWQSIRWAQTGTSYPVKFLSVAIPYTGLSAAMCVTEVSTIATVDPSVGAPSTVESVVVESATPSTTAWSAKERFYVGDIGNVILVNNDKAAYADVMATKVPTSPEPPSIMLQVLQSMTRDVDKSATLIQVKSKMESGQRSADVDEEVTKNGISRRPLEECYRKRMEAVSSLNHSLEKLNEATNELQASEDIFAKEGEDYKQLSDNCKQLSDNCKQLSKAATAQNVKLLKYVKQYVAGLELTHSCFPEAQLVFLTNECFDALTVAKMNDFGLKIVEGERAPTVGEFAWHHFYPLRQIYFPALVVNGETAQCHVRENKLSFDADLNMPDFLERLDLHVQELKLSAQFQGLGVSDEI